MFQGGWVSAFLDRVPAGNALEVAYRIDNPGTYRASTVGEDGSTFYAVMTESGGDSHLDEWDASSFPPALVSRTELTGAEGEA